MKRTFSISMIALVIAACSRLSPTAVGLTETGRSEGALTAAPATLDEAELTGKVIQKRWRKSAESWNAGGSDYLVLEVGGVPVKEKTAAEGVLLKASPAVPRAALAEWGGKRVTVTGIYVAARAYKPRGVEHYPMGLDRKPLPRGAGFRVLAIRAAD